MLFHQLMLAGSAQPIVSIYHDNKASVEYTARTEKLTGFFYLVLL
jgi:hypothetical protein